MNAHGALRSLRDVDGVLGSFVFDDEGLLLESDMPAYFDRSTLEQAAPRLRRLIDALTSRGDAVDHCMVRFSAQVLWLHPFAPHFLCVLAPPETNTGSLRTGAQLVARRLAKLLAEPSAGHSGSALPTQPLTASPAASSTSMGLASPVPLRVEAEDSTDVVDPRPTGRSRVPGAGPSRGRRLFRGRPVD